MMVKPLISVGIDIGTTTTHVVFSRLTIQKSGGFGTIPRYAVTQKDVFYRSRTHFTPLIGDDEIDAQEIRCLIASEFIKAGVDPRETDTGAVIITGETSRRRNAREVVLAVSDMAGDFVVAEAGPDLESILAGKGSGAEELSRETRKVVVNLDIGGGTTNVCFFDSGEVVDTACLFIGGRLIRIENGRITYIAAGISELLRRKRIHLSLGQDTGDPLVSAELDRAAQLFVRIFEESILLCAPSEELKDVTNRLITYGKKPDIIMLSGGVADCIDDVNEDPFRYGDIGGLLGCAVARSELIGKRRHRDIHETIHATVIGAVNHSMKISGSTIFYQNIIFPMKNVPVFRIKMKGKSLDDLADRIRNMILRIVDDPDGAIDYALAFDGLSCPSYDEIGRIASAFAKARDCRRTAAEKWILVMEEDIAKALGQALRRLLPSDSEILCIDAIHCEDGDYLDVGEPIGTDQAIPVIVKTLIYTLE